MSLFERYSARSGIEVRSRHDGLDARRLGASVETAAHRIVQEALTHVARHAAVSQVSVHAVTTPGNLRIRVQDHGQGFDPATALAAGGSSGLRGMKDRVSLMDGGLEISSAPGAGTLILAELPIKAGVVGSGS